MSFRDWVHGAKDLMESRPLLAFVALFSNYCVWTLGGLLYLIPQAWFVDRLGDLAKYFYAAFAVAIVISPPACLMLLIQVWRHAKQRPY